ncbi:uncharacterized protein LOC131168649 [Malania oleifera]|uniref:uncharacterized protein LOC131168649 n=1 Tax=Malania oleifera TaxID=397392 RepID=UPI0025AE3D56|nr:uncharacterized protein LOC131168649 [Malania oleifera]
MSVLIDFQLRMTSPLSYSPSLQNPKLEPHPSSFFRSISISEKMSSPAAEFARDCGAEGVYSSPAVPRSGNEKLSVSGAPGRSRPRFVKMRRHFGSQQRRPGSVPKKIGPGFNPFCSMSESSDRVVDNGGVSNEFRNLSGEINSVKFGDMSFVFGANRSDSAASLGSYKIESCEHARKSVSVGRGYMKVDSGNAAVKLNAGNGEFNESVGNLRSNDRQNIKSEGVVELGNFGNVCFAFGVDGSGLSLKSKKEKREFGETVGTSGSGDRLNVKFESGAESGEVDKVGCVFDSSQIVYASNSNLENRESGNNVGNLVSEDSGAEKENIGNLASDNGSEIKVNCEAANGKYGNAGFVFGAGQNNSVRNSKMERRKSAKNVGKYISGDRVKMKLGIDVEFGKYDSVGFVFGADHSDLVSNSNLEKKECCEQTGSFVSADKRKVKIQGKTYFETVQVAAVDYNAAANGSLHLDGSDESSSFTGNKAHMLPGGTDMNCENFGKCDGNTKAQNSNLGSNVNDKYTSVFGSNSGSDSSSCRMASASGINSVFKLSDEMKKLNIDSFVNVDGPDKCKGSKLSPCSQADDTFVSRSISASGSSTVCSAASNSHLKNSPSEVPGSGNAFEKTNQFNLKTSDNKNFKSESSKINFMFFYGGTENMVPNETRSGLGCSSEFFGKEGQPIKLNDERFDHPATGCSPPAFTYQAGLAKFSDAGQYPEGQVNDGADLNGDAKPSSFSSIHVSFLPKDSAFEAPTVGGFESKDRGSFTSVPNGVGSPCTNVKTLKSDASFSFTTNFFPGLNKKSEFSSKNGSAKNRRLKKEKGKLRQHTPAKQCCGNDFMAQENLNSPGCYSPMDFSPYQETAAAEQCSRETSSALNECFHGGNNSAPTTAYSTLSTDATDEKLTATRERLATNEGGQIGIEKNEGISQDHENHFCDECLMEEFVPKAETPCQESKTEQACMGGGTGIASAEAGAGFGLKTEKQESSCRGQFGVSSSSEDMRERKFTFSASSPAPGCLSAAKHQYRKKNRLKGSCDSSSSNSSTKFKFASSIQFSAPNITTSNSDSMQGQKGNSSIFHGKAPAKSKADELQVKLQSIFCSTMEEAWEKWRLRGNQAYKDGNLSKAEDCYTKGINSASPGETLGCCLEPLVLCYSNRAATRMSLGRIREALGDCMMAVKLDPNFLKAQYRAANCHLMLGEVDNALQYYSKCVESVSGLCLDRRIIIEAFDGIQKAQKVDEHVKESAELLQKRTSDAAVCALRIIAEACSICPYSERLLEMKAEALCRLRKYEEVIHLCEQTIDFAKKNFASAGIDNHSANMEVLESKSSSFLSLWRLCLMSKSYFYLGKLEMALKQQEQARSIMDEFGNKKLGSSAPLAATIRELLRHKNAGNEAFLSGKYTEAVEHYTAALSMNVESRPFAAVCFCNRAAAHQALGQFADAIADCSVAMALDGTYQKAISRRATLHEMIRDYGQAATDLRRFLSALENQSHGTPDRRSRGVREIQQAQIHLSSIEEEAKKGIPLDLYLILGIKASDAASEIKKAYRKAALRHHPDKAGQFLTRSGSGDDGQLWKEIVDEVHRDADRLFKMIGEAYAVLSDPTKRSEYEEKIRKIPKERNGSSASTRPSGTHSYPFETSPNRRKWRGTPRAYGHQHSQW